MGTEGIWFELLEEAISGSIINDTNWTSDIAQTFLIATTEDIIWQARPGGGLRPAGERWNCRDDNVWAHLRPASRMDVCEEY